MKRIIRILLIIVIAGAAIAGGIWLYQTRSAAQSTTQTDMFTQVVAVQQGDLSASISVVGALEAVQQTDAGLRPAERRHDLAQLWTWRRQHGRGGPGVGCHRSCAAASRRWTRPAARCKRPRPIWPTCETPPTALGHRPGRPGRGRRPAQAGTGRGCAGRPANLARRERRAGRCADRSGQPGPGRAAADAG